MPDESDMELLRNYTTHGTEAAFAGLVERHVGLVYSAALRQVGIAAHAEEITQAVFVILARKAAGLRPDSVLEAWLYETTRLASLNFLRGERRRQSREQEAYMHSNFLEHTDDSVWNQLSPFLDEAMARLGKEDREAVILRFFKEKKLAEVAEALSITEAAAQSRVHRALEKLRKNFAKHGVTSTTAAIGETIAANSIQAAPAGLASTISYAALSAKTTATALTATKTMTILQKAFATTATIAAAGAIIYAAHLNSQLRLLQAQNASLAGQIQRLQQQLSDANSQISSLNDQIASSDRNADELLRLRAEVTQLHRNESLPQAIATHPPKAPGPLVQIHLKTRFYSIPDGDLQSMGIAWTADSQGGQMGYLGEPQLKNILEAMRGASDITVLAEPEVVQSNGRETEMFEGTTTNPEEIFDATSYYSTNSSTFNMRFEAVVSQLSGDASQPTVQTIQITNQVTFAYGKTLVLEQPIPTGSWLPGMTNIPSGLQDLALFVTATPVDSAGNPIRPQ